MGSPSAASIRGFGPGSQARAPEKIVTFVTTSRAPAGLPFHHERVDGKGYPDGLSGDQLPLIGKIVGLADTFDAMTSKRTYRDAMSIEQALAEIKKGLGTQFDEKIGRIFLESDVYRLWEIIRDGFGDVYRNSASAEYGTAAVGMLIK